ncbi:MAG TPA: YpdA family putative bacillithiol disulfide reductase [Flavobacteriaceae bacterium]|nr:YpdA family putative bacillithiol disulfide reductase [Flavobacteriaceae bacterium]
MDDKKDVLIIGGGPIGLACGLSCQEHNLSFTIIEKGVLVNSIYNYPRNMRFFSTSDKLEIGGIPFISAQPKPDRDEALAYYGRIGQRLKTNLALYEKVERIDGNDEHFQVITDKAVHYGRKVILATGFYDLPKMLNVPGELSKKVRHYFDEGHPYAFKKTIVVGASNSAVDAALEIYRKGGEVTMVVRGPAIGERVKYWVKPDIENRIAEGSIKAYFNSQIPEISDNQVTVMTTDGSQQLANDFVLALTGYRPNLSFLQDNGIAIQEQEFQTPQYNKETMESNRLGLYLAGVICGGLQTHLWFIENSRVHAERIIRDISAHGKSR